LVKQGGFQKIFVYILIENDLVSFSSFWNIDVFLNILHVCMHNNLVPKNLIILQVYFIIIYKLFMLVPLSFIWHIFQWIIDFLFPTIIIYVLY
jgi:hypothetical protein